MMGTTTSAPVAGQKRKRPNFLSMDQTLVEITIGDESFMLHKGLLCSHSKYFKAAFEGDFRDVEDKAVQLPGVTDSTLKLFQFWLYGQATREVPERVIKRPRRHGLTDQRAQEKVADVGEETIRDEESETEDLQLDMLFNPKKTPAWLDIEEFRFKTGHSYLQTFASLYAFADVYDTPQLREDVMTLLVELYNLNQGKEKSDMRKTLQELYDAVAASSPLCKYLVKRTAVYGDFRNIKRSTLEELPKEFLVDMLLATTPLKRVNRAKLKEETRDSCNFHEHSSSEETVSCKRRQLRDGAFYVSFLRACMSEVYAQEEDVAQLQTPSSTPSIPIRDTCKRKESDAALRIIEDDSDTSITLYEV